MSGLLSHLPDTLPNPRVTNGKHKALFSGGYPEMPKKIVSLPESLPAIPFQLDLTMVFVIIKAHLS